MELRQIGDALDPSQEELREARKFKSEMEARGAKVILTAIPFDRESYWKTNPAVSAEDALLLAPENEKKFHREERLAKALGVPLVMGPVKGLQTIEGSHLTGESA
jgi:hypothetical protein